MARDLLQRWQFAGEQVAVDVQPALDAFGCRQPSQIALAHRLRPSRLPAVEPRQQVPREAFKDMFAIHDLEAFGLQAGALVEGAQRRHLHGAADEHAEHQPIGNVGFRCSRRPGQPTTTDNATIKQDRIRPRELQRFFRRTVLAERIRRGIHPGVEGEPRRRQRHLRFKHHRRFDRIEPPHPDQRPSAFVGGEDLGIGERIAVFAHRDGAKPWRQVKLLVIGIRTHAGHL